MDANYDDNSDDEDSDSEDDWQNSIATTDIDTTDGSDVEYDAEVLNHKYKRTIYK